MSDELNTMPELTLDPSGAAAAIWWKAYLKAAKADNPKKDSEEKKHG